MIRIYGRRFSPFVRKVLVVAELLGIEVEPIAFEAHAPPPEFIAGSPLGKMPLLIDGDYVLPDSSAIVAYLNASAGVSASVFPDDPKALGQALWFEEYADTAMQGVVSTVFFNRIVKAVLRGQHADQSAIRHGIEVLLPPVLAYLESALPEPGSFLCGERITIADVAIASALVNFSHAGILPGSETGTRLAAWAAFMFDQPCFAGPIAEERTTIEKRRTTVAN